MVELLVRFWFRLSLLPETIYSIIANGFSGAVAALFFLVGGGRRYVAMTNLRVCFPESTRGQRALWTLSHMFYFLRTFLDRGWIWAGDDALFKSRVIIKNPEELKRIAQLDKPVIFLAPHFLGLDAAGSRIAMEIPMVTMYSKQKSDEFDQIVLQGRQRHGDLILVSRKEGVRPLIKQIKSGRSLYYLPDMDFGPKDSVFAPFFGTQAATLPVVGRLAKMLDLPVVPVTSEYRSGRYYVTIHPEMEDFPTPDDVSSAGAMNAFIESEIPSKLPQYYWMHKRFKTRPEGQASIY